MNKGSLKTCCTCKEPQPEWFFTKQNRICKNCRNISNKKYRRKNKALVNAKNRASYYRNKPARRKNQKKYELKIKELARTDKYLHVKCLVKAARSRAKKINIPFDLTFKDITIPERCPILGILLKRNRLKIGADSASLDRIDPSKGYVKSNVLVISLKANLIKTNASPEEILKVGLFYKTLMEKSDGSHKS